MSDLASSDGGEAESVDLRSSLAEILDEWARLVREEPWHVPPTEKEGDVFLASIEAVLSVATWSGAGSAAHARLVRAASAHGEQRRLQPDGSAVLLAEYHALRTAVWRFLSRASLERPAVLAAVLRADVASDVATTVALRAYHRSATSSTESWELDLLRQVEAVSRHLVDRLGGRGNP